MNEFELAAAGYVGLESFPNPETGRRYSIEFACPEWTALCPKSGFPDFGTITIRYEPRESCVELKSLKLYINSYREMRIFHEGAVNKILTDLVAATKPWWMEISGDFNVRGNIKTIIKCQWRARDYDTFREKDFT